MGMWRGGRNYRPGAQVKTLITALYKKKIKSWDRSNDRKYKTQ